MNAVTSWDTEQIVFISTLKKFTCWLNVEFPPGIGKLDGAAWSKSRGEPGLMFLFSFVE